MPAILWGLHGWETATEPQTAVSGGGILLSVELWRATIANALVEDITGYLVDGQIEMNVDRDIKLSASFTLRNPDVVTPYTDYLAPFIRLTYDDGSDSVYSQLGLYAVTVPPGSYTVEDAVATFTGQDLTRVLATDAYVDADNVASSTNVVTEIIATLAESGITRYTIPATTTTLAAAATFPAGTTRLDKCNQLLAAMGWYHLGMGLDGRVSTPGAVRELRYVEPFATLTDADVWGAVEVTPNDADLANVVIVVNDDPNAAPLTATARNDDASSPTSTSAIGREIYRVVRVQGETTQAALNALAARYLAESRTYYRVAKLRIAPNPNALRPHQTVDLNLTGKLEGLSGRWWVRTAKMGLTPQSAPVELELNQISDDLNGVTV